MQECSEAEDLQQDEANGQAVELSIVILVDGEEKCCSKIQRGSKGVKQSASNRSIENPCPNCQSSTSRPTTPTAKQSTSTTSLPCGNGNKKIIVGPKCKKRCPQHGHDCPYEEDVDPCENCGQPRIIQTPQSNCPCAAYQNAPCGGMGAPLVRVKSQTAACQTISHGECQTDPMSYPPQPCQAAPMPVQQPCPTAVMPVQQPCPATAPPAIMNQTAACQTGTEGQAPVQQIPARPCTPKKKKCQKRAKSAICQTHAQPPQAVRSRPQIAEQTMVVQSQVQTCVQVQPVSQPCPQAPVSQPCPQAPIIQPCPQAPISQPCQPVPVCPPVPSCQQLPVMQPVSSCQPVASAVQIQQTTYTVVGGVAEQQCQAFAEQVGRKEETPPMEEPTAIEDQKPRAKEDKVRKVRRPSKEEKLKDPAEARKARRSSLPPEQLNFSHFPTVQLNFVDYFLKSEGGVASVINLAETKLEYEKKCKSLLAGMPNSKRGQAEEFFNTIIEAIQVKVPESNNTEIKHYHLSKYLQPIVSSLNLEAHEEVHAVTKYHNYIMTVVNFMEERLRERQVINPDAMIDVETHLLAGIMSRFYPIFIKIKEAAISMSTQRHGTVPSDEFVRQLRKLILAIYVEIICIDVTFNNTLTSLSYLPSVEVQESYRHQMAIRKKHARHSVTWAARCVTTVLLYYHVGTAM